MADYQEDFDLNIPALPALTEAGADKGIQVYVNPIPAIPTLTEQATDQTPTADPTIFLLYGDGAYTDYTTEATEDTPDDVPLTGSLSPVSGDWIMIGCTDPFWVAGFDVTTAGVGGYEIKYVNYWNGVGWGRLYANRGEVGNFKTVDVLRMAWDVPDDWATRSLNGSPDYYYVGIEYLGGVGGTITTVPLARRVYISSGSTAWTLDVSDTLSMSDAVSHGIGLAASDSLSLSDGVSQAMGLVVSDSLSLSDAVSFYQIFAGGRVQLPLPEVVGRMPGRNVTYSGNALDAYPAMTQFPNLEQSAAILVQTWGNALTFKLSPDGVNYQDEEEVDPDKNLGSWFHRGSARGIAVKNKSAGLVARYQVVVFFV